MKKFNFYCEKCKHRHATYFPCNRCIDNSKNPGSVLNRPTKFKVARRFLIKPTATSYTKGFVEDNPDDDDLTKLIMHKSNLILNLKFMSKKERRKASIEIINCEISIAEAMLDDNIKSKWKERRSPRLHRLEAADSLSSGLNTLSIIKRYKPTFTNQKIEKAWKLKKPMLLLEPSDIPKKN